MALHFQKLEAHSGGDEAIEEVKVARWGNWTDGQTNPSETNHSPLITAVRDTDGDLRVILWDVSEHPWKRSRTMHGGTASDIALAPLSATRAATAHRNPAGHLKVSLWDTYLPHASAVDPEASATGGTASEVAVTGLSYKRCVTAVRDADGELRLAVWDYDSDTKVLTKITKGDFEDAGDATDISIGSLQPSGVVTAMRTAAGTLKVIFWSVDEDGKITRTGDAVEGKANQVRIVGLSTEALTAVRNGQGELELDRWQGSGPKLAGNSAGAIGALDLALLGGSWKVATAVRDGEGNLKVIVWDAYDRHSLPRLGDEVGEAATRVACCGAFNNPGGFAWIASAIRDESGHLKVKGWKVSNFPD